MKLYLCGPMTGIPLFNYPAFMAAAEALRARGHDVLNPAENDADTSKPYDYYIRKAIAQVLESEAIALLPGWRKSRGANLEVTIGRTLSLRLFDFVDGDIKPFVEESVCAEADRLVDFDRQNSYGPPEEDFSRIVGMLNALGYRHEKRELKATDFPVIMICAKLSREMNAHKRDNSVDISGYSKCLERVANHELQTR